MRCIICKSIKSSCIDTKHKTSLISGSINQVINRSASSLFIIEIRNNTSDPVTNNSYCIKSKEFINLIFLKTFIVKVFFPDRICCIISIISKISLNSDYLHEVVSNIIIRINPSVRNVIFFSIPIKECHIKTCEIFCFTNNQRNI